MASTTTPTPPETDESRAAANSSSHPQPGGTYPPSTTMSYANPQQGYPATGAPPFQGYPANAGYAAYNPYYADPSGAGGYYATTTYSQPDGAATSFMRCFCIFMFLILMFTLLFSVVMVTIVRPDAAKFKVDSLSVSNFNIVPANKIVSGKWEATIFVENPSFNLRLYVDRWDVALYHKDDYLTSGTINHSMLLESKSKGTMQVKMETYNSTASGAAEDMAREQKEGGNVGFQLRMTLLYTMKSGWWYHQYRTGTLRVKCPDLKVSLPAGANTGSMPGGSSSKCEISDGF